MDTLGQLHHEAQVVQGGKAHEEGITLFEEVMEITKRVTAAAGAIAKFADGGGAADIAFIIHISKGEPVSGQAGHPARQPAG